MHTTIIVQRDFERIIQTKLDAYIQKLSLDISWIVVDKLNNKTIKHMSTSVTTPFLMVELNKKGHLECVLCTVEVDNKGNSTIIKVSPDWHKHQRRIVTAGRKSELLLQACKLSPDSQVLDATAGFGHDSLILASTLANQQGQVTMIEQNPVMALLLMLEQSRMRSEKNWQGLMSRLNVQFGCFSESFIQVNEDSLINEDLINKNSIKYDVVYLDPMFPKDSYEGAKVSKGMQVLHNLAQPPTPQEESQLLQLAKSVLTSNGRVVVKRPKQAPFLSNTPPDESWSNEVVRFDGYFKL